MNILNLSEAPKSVTQTFIAKEILFSNNQEKLYLSCIAISFVSFLILFLYFFILISLFDCYFMVKCNILYRKFLTFLISINIENSGRSRN